MADSKGSYSDAATAINDNRLDDKLQKEYDKSRARHDKHVHQWSMNKVNLNEVVEKYAPGAIGVQDGIKMIYKGSNYNVVAVLASGYVRLIDANTGNYLNLNGEVDANDDNTHFRIKKRKEM